MNFNNYFQTTYLPNMPVGFPGGLADCGFKDTVSGCAIENIPFGRGVVHVYGTDFAYALPGTRNSLITITGEFVASNSTAITYNGGAIGPVVFNTSHEQTVKDIITLLLAQPTINQAFYTFNSDGTTSIEVSAVPPATTAVTAFVTTGGASQPTNVIVESTTDTFFGVAQYEPAQSPLNSLFLNDPTIQPGFFAGDPMNILRWGRIYVSPEEAVNQGDPVYMRVTDGAAGQYRGQFRKSADGGAAVLIATAQWYTSAPANGIAVLQLNP